MVRRRSTRVDLGRPAGSAPAPGPGLVVGLSAAVLLVAAALVVPRVLDWDVRARSDRFGVPPLHGFWEPGMGPGTVPALLLAGVAVLWGGSWAARASWRALVATSYAVSLAWLLSLALVDGVDGLTRVSTNPTEYLATARGVGDVGAMLSGYVERIPMGAAEQWPIHVAGHPPGALLLHVALVRIGLGGDLEASLVICALAASIPTAVLVTLSRLGAAAAARRAAPFLVLSPAAVFLAVAADAAFAAFAAWGLAALATAATRRRGAAWVGWSLQAGVLLGWCVMSSYGLPLLGPLALAVLLAARSWRPLLPAALAALAVVLGFAAAGFAWWEAYPVLHDRYWAGLAADRPAAYWLWGNLAALLVATGPLLGAGLAALRSSWPRERTVVLLVLAAAVAVVVADLSRMSKAEVERIWLPFVPWLSLSMALLPARWRRWGLGLQVVTALVVQHLLYTTW